MSQTIQRVAADPPSSALRDTLTHRYDMAYQAWLRQDAAVHAMRDTADSGPGDEADRAAIHIQLDEQAALADVARGQLADLAAAVLRCGDGTYGMCDQCRDYIPIERLALFPAATHCVACQQRREHR